MVNNIDQKKIIFVVQNYFKNSKILNIIKIDSGLINKTYLIEHLINGVKSKFILQCISNIFESHEIVSMNHKLITDHIKKKIRNNDAKFDFKRWEVPTLIKCKANNRFVFPCGSDFWRAMIYIDNTFTFDILEDKLMAYQAGRGLSIFHSICSDIDSSKLGISINNFHNTKYYIKQYKLNIRDYNFLKLDFDVNKRVQNLIFSLSNHILYVEFILGYLKKKSIDYNVIHGDPKLSNFLFDIKSRYVVSLIDLDTISSGYLLTDLADCIRSICNLAGDDPQDINDVFFDISNCRNFLIGYFSILNKKGNYCFGSLSEFIYLIILELTVRFFNDFLQSNKYFKINYQTQNLHRAEAQYKLLSSFVTQIPVFSNSLHDIGFSQNQNFVSDVQKIV